MHIGLAQLEIFPAPYPLMHVPQITRNTYWR